MTRKHKEARNLEVEMVNHLDKASVETLEWLAEFLQFWLRRMEISLKNRKDSNKQEGK